MTEPTSDQGRRTQIVEIKGRPVVIRELVDLQLVHMMRYARILQSDNVETPQKMEAVERMFNILHTVVVQPTDREYLIEMEEAGELSIRDMLGFVSAFQDEDAVKKPAVRRGRATVKR